MRTRNGWATPAAEAFPAWAVPGGRREAFAAAREPGGTKPWPGCAHPAVSAAGRGSGGTKPWPGCVHPAARVLGGMLRWDAMCRWSPSWQAGAASWRGRPAAPGGGRRTRWGWSAKALHLPEPGQPDGEIEPPQTRREPVGATRRHGAARGAQPTGSQPVDAATRAVQPTGSQPADAAARAVQPTGSQPADAAMWAVQPTRSRHAGAATVAARRSAVQDLRRGTSAAGRRACAATQWPGSAFPAATAAPRWSPRAVARWSASARPSQRAMARRPGGDVRTLSKRRRQTGDAALPSPSAAPRAAFPLP